MKIGILTFHRAFNCGAMLQAWALQKILTKEGHQVEFPNCNKVGVAPRFRSPVIKKEGFREIIRAYLFNFIYNLLSIGITDAIRARYYRFLKQLTCADCMPHQFAEQYDAIIVGSDQVWNERISKPNTSLFLGDGIPSYVPMIAYAASMGDEIPEGNYREQIKASIGRFKAISLREETGCKHVKSICGLDVTRVLDPTLLLNAEDYQPIEAKITVQKNLLFSYLVASSNKVIEKLQTIANALGVDYRFVRSYESSYRSKPKAVSAPVAPDQLLAYTKHAKYVIPASFHGMVFAMLYRKPFVMMRPKKDEQPSRSEAFLRLLGMENRIVTPETPLETILQVINTPYPDDFDVRLEVLRNASLDWLRNALQK